MTTASKQLIQAAIAAYKKLDESEREVFAFVVEADEPAPRRGRPAGSRNKQKDAPEAA